MEDWDDLRFFIAVVRAGNLAGAAKSLGVNYTTINRRINHFEEKIGFPLFERLTSGYVLTPDGENLLESSLVVETKMAEIGRLVQNKGVEVAGVIRFISHEPVLAVLMPYLMPFLEKYPAIDLEFLGNTEVNNLNKRDIDMALQITNHPPEHLFGIELCKIRSTLYGAKTYLSGFAPNAALAEYTWIGWEKRTEYTIIPNRVREVMPAKVRVATTAPNEAILWEALKAGMGVSYFWRFFADKEPTLSRIDGEQFTHGLWLMVHHDLLQVQRYKLLFDYVIGIVRDSPQLFDAFEDNTAEND